MTSRDDPQMVKAVTQISLKLNISKTVRDRRMVEMETAYYDSNGHVTDDVSVNNLRLRMCYEPTTAVTFQLTRVKRNRYSWVVGQMPRSTGTERISC